MKKIVSMFLVVAMLLGITSSIGAEEIFDDTLTESSGFVILSVKDAVDQDNGIALCGMYFSYGTSRIVNRGNYYVAVEGVTYATRDYYDFLSAKVFIEQFRNGVWQPYDSHVKTTGNKLTVAMSYMEAVPSGYYYRCRTIHCVRHNGTVESGASMTGGIWIGK